jgi:hypothetical protein
MITEGVVVGERRFVAQRKSRNLKVGPGFKDVVNTKMSIEEEKG